MGEWPIRLVFHKVANNNNNNNNSSSRNSGEGNGKPLENPMGGGAWWAVVHGVTKSRA